MRFRTLPTWSRIMLGAAGERDFSTFVGELMRSTPRKVSTTMVYLEGEAGILKLAMPPPYHQPVVLRTLPTPKLLAWAA